MFDQSVFVENAVSHVLKEAVLVGLLVALVVLVFLGSWRSSLIVLTSIPLALLASIAGLSLTGNTFNLMTLGGLMLAIGILVDNALVEIENINRNLEAGLGLREAILEERERGGVSGVRIDGRDLHRVFADLPAHRNGGVRVRAHGACRHVRHGGVVRSVAHAGAVAREPDAFRSSAASCTARR